MTKHYLILSDICHSNFHQTIDFPMIMCYNNTYQEKETRRI